MSADQNDAEPNHPQLTAQQLAAGIRLGLLHFSQGRWDDARPIFLVLSVVDPQNAYLHAMLGAVYQQMGEDDNATSEYSAAIELFPQDIASLVNRGEIALKAGRVKEAFQDLTRAIELDPGKKHPSSNRARLLVTTIDDALRLVDQKGLSGLKELRPSGEPTK
jgi:Flp pilus assembly protein TadD